MFFLRQTSLLLALIAINACAFATEITVLSAAAAVQAPIEEANSLRGTARSKAASCPGKNLAGDLPPA